jgi:hypothetical protein
MSDLLDYFNACYGNTTQSTPTATEFDYDRHIVDSVDDSLWRAIFDGHFRLAVRCKVCQRWLVDGRSKRAQCGPRCASKAKAADEAAA